jgi:hypothetical protein
VEVALQQAAHNPVTSLEDLLAADGLARRVASEIADARP